MAERLIEPLGDDARVAFIDLEASGLSARSWPIEVGWAFRTGAPTSLVIRPHASWKEGDWDPKAENLHGLTRAVIERDGLAPEAVAAAVNEALADAMVYSDAPDWDGFWLYRLFSAAGVKQGFTVLDFNRFLRPLAGAREDKVLQKAAQTAPRLHRAGADAKHLQTVYALALEHGATRLTR